MTLDDDESTIIKYVNPYNLPKSNNLELISLLNPNYKQQQQAEQSQQYSNFKIPILKSIDVSNLIELNNIKIQNQINEQKRSYNSTNNTSGNKDKDNIILNYNHPDNQSDKNKQVDDDEEEEVDDDDDDEKLMKFIPIEEFKFKNFHNQLGTVVINGFPNDLKLQILEKLLNLLIKKTRKYNWSLINSNNTIIDLRLIFIKFDHLVDLKWFLETYSNSNSNSINEIIPGCSIIKNDLIQNNLDSIIIKPDNITNSLKSKINLIINNSKNKQIKNLTGLEDLDQVLNSYSNYKVDNNDLIDIPNDMKESIVKDIIKFRSRMLLIEKDSRKREIEQERINTKNKLKRLFEGLKESTDGNNSNINNNNDDDENSLELLKSNREEFEELNDEEYNELIENKKINQIEEEFNNHLKNWEINQNKEIKKLIENLKILKNYENQLIDNKLKFIDDFKKLNNNDLLNLYNFKYNDYLKLRNQKRSIEEQKDELDRLKEQEEKELEESTTIQEPQLESHPEQKQEQKQEQEQEQESESQPEKESELQSEVIEEEEPMKKKIKLEINIKNLSKDLKSKLNDKIIELIEEYLGIKDEILIQVINENLINFNLSNKQELINELIEILDDDAENLVNDLWNFIQHKL